jgi:hypothetical protein
MDVRRAALAAFGERGIRTGVPLATLEEVLVPVYLHHRYQVEATASVIGGMDYGYALRGDGLPAARFVPAAQQRAALAALSATLAPAELALPRTVLAVLPPRPSGYGRNRELFPRQTGAIFDAITPAVVAADHTIGSVLNPERAARLIQQKALDETMPGFEEILDGLVAATFGARTNDAYEAEIRRATERVLVDNLMGLAARAPMPQVRALAMYRLERQATALARPTPNRAEADAAHHALLVRDIQRFLDDPSAANPPAAAPAMPPGAPIQPDMDWLGTLEPLRSWWESDGWH